MNATTTTLDQLTPFQQWMLRHADSDYVAARLIYYTNTCYPVVPFLCREAVEKYLKLLLLRIKRIPDTEAGAEIRSYRHRLVEILKACQSSTANESDPRLWMLSKDKQLIDSVSFVDDQRYEAVARYPNTFALPGNVVQIFDSLISQVRDFYLEMKDTNPLEIVFDRLGQMVGWPIQNKQLVTTAFHDQNEKFLLQNLHAP